MSTLIRMLKNSLEIEGYLLKKWNLIILRRNAAFGSRKELVFNGIEALMEPSDEMTTFIKNLI